MKIYIPGRGSVDSDVYKVDKAVNQYNERLSFKLNEESGDYCVYMRMPFPKEPVAVLGVGKNVPHPDYICKRLRESDVRIHGDKLFDMIVKEQNKAKEEKRYLADQASSDAAERIEKMLRNNGKSPVVKVFPNDKKGVVKSDA